jgi:putative membrane protein
MKSASIWAVALAATLSVACNGNGNINDNNTAGGPDRTGTATADRTPGDANRPGTAGSDPASRDPGASATMARASNADNDREFVEKMGQVNLAEVKLGQLAAERASNAQVKQFARRMVSDHEKANAELKQVASKMAVQVPAALDAKHQELHDRLSKLKGAEFDREYMQAMVDGHQEVAQELERHADTPGTGERSVGTSGDANQAHASVSAWAKKTLPDVRQHLDQAKQIHAKL